MLVAIHGMRTKWLPANKANASLCILCWLPFVGFVILDFIVGSIVGFSKGKDV